MRKNIFGLVEYARQKEKGPEQCLNPDLDILKKRQYEGKKERKAENHQKLAEHQGYYMKIIYIKTESIKLQNNNKDTEDDQKLECIFKYLDNISNYK